MFIVVLLTACKSQSVEPEKIAVAFQNAGLTAENIRPFDLEKMAVTLPCNGYWFDTPGFGKGGTFFICKSEQDRDSVVRYYTKLSEASPLFQTQTFSKGLFVVSMDGKMNAELARRYGEALPE